MRRLGAALGATLVIAATGLALAAASARGKAPPPPPPPPPPQVDVTLDAPLPDREWVLKLANTGTDAVRVVADPRLVSFDVTTQGHDHHCTLPAEMTPTTDTERTLVIPGGRSWSVRIDPLLYCFSAADVAALAPGAIVTASFGWPAARYAPPFAVTPTTVIDGGVGPARRVSAPAITIAPVQVAPALDAGPPGVTFIDAGEAVPLDAYPVHLKVSLPDRLDVSRVFEQTVTVTISNEGDRPVHTLVTPPTIGFLVQMPNGLFIRCGANAGVSAIAELMTTLAPRGRTAVTIDLGTTCGPFMRQPGLYRVRPRLDTQRSTPPTGSTSFWQGEAVGAPMLMRIRTGDDPLPAPRLDPVR